MSSLSNILSLARQLKETVGPPQPRSSPSPSSLPPIPPLHLAPPHDIVRPLLQLGVAPALSSLLSEDYIKHASQARNAILSAYDEMTVKLRRGGIASCLPAEEQSSFLLGQDSSVLRMFQTRYQQQLHHLEQSVLKQVSRRRHRFNQVQKRQQQYQHSTRKGFAKKSVEVLRKIYLVESYPNIAELRVIAEHIGMDYKQTRVWFQNRRNRKKRSKRGIHEDNRIAKLSGLPPPNPSRITKRTIQQRKENAILRASSSPQLVKKLPVKLAALNIKKGGAKSSAAATRRRLELQEQREREDRELEMQQQMGLVSMEPVDDVEDMETGSGGAEARQGMEGFQSFSFTYNVQPPSSLSPNPRASHPSSQHSYSSHSQPQRHYSNEQQPSYSSSSSYHPSSNNSPTYPPYSSSSSSQDYYASQQPSHHSSHHPHHSQSHHQYPSSSSQHSLPLQPPPLHPSSYPPAPVELLKNLWDIASVDPLSSYETFARAPAVPSEGLSFITPLPSDHLHHHSSSSHHNQTLLVEPPWYAVLPAMDSSSPVVATGGEQAQQQGGGGWGELLSDETRREEVGAYDYSHLLMGEDLGGGVAPAGAINGYLRLNGNGGESTFMVDQMFEQFEEGGMLSFVVPEAASSW